MKVLLINEFGESKMIELSVLPEVGDRMRFDSTSMCTSVKRINDRRNPEDFEGVNCDAVIVI